jgi:hypothetical protein
LEYSSREVGVKQGFWAVQIPNNYLNVHSSSAATFMPAMDLLNNDGIDIQVFVYDKNPPPLKG